jgi:hypothetical protein
VHSQKTVKPVSVGGIAGGEKFIVQGILFKFAVDSHGLYGSTNAAAKTAGQELKSLKSLLNVDLGVLHVPLMALLDYRGYRLIAMTLLPIGSSSLVYGSADAGNTVINNEYASVRLISSFSPSASAKFAAHMEDVSRSLNLKGHLCGFVRCVLCGELR